METSVTVSNSPIQGYVDPDDHTQPTYEMTPGFNLSQDVRFLSHNAPYLPLKISHNLCFSFLLGIKAVPREIETMLMQNFEGVRIACFVIPGSLGRVLVLRKSEANARHFSPRRQTNMRKMRPSCRKKENLKR